MDKVIYIARHGETDFNKLKIVQGSGVDSSLNEKGRRQANALYHAYHKIPFDLIITSALVRTQETAKGFIDAGILHMKDGDIDEICWGIHEGKSDSPDMKQDYVRLMNAWKNGDYNARIEEGESALELADRLSRALQNIKQRTEKNILVLTHGRSIRCLMCLIEGRELKYMDSYQHNNTGVYKIIQKGDEFQMVTKNDIDHLKDLDS
jgi:probable phosphoglycerate mutase